MSTDGFMLSFIQRHTTLFIAMVIMLAVFWAYLARYVHPTFITQAEGSEMSRNVGQLTADVSEIKGDLIQAEINDLNNSIHAIERLERKGAADSTDIEYLEHLRGQLRGAERKLKNGSTGNSPPPT